MKILMVNKFLHPNGGSETYIFKLGEELVRQGHEVEYFGMEHPNRKVGNSVGCYMSSMDFHTGKIQKLLYPFKIVYSLEARKKIKIILEQFRPDIIHLNNINFQITPSIVYEIKKHDIPIVYTAHDYQWVCPNHLMMIPSSKERCFRCKGGNFGQCIKYRCIHNSLARSILGTVEAKLYYRLKTYQNIDKIVCPSRFMMDMLGTNIQLKDKLVLLYNFLDSEGRDTVEKQKYVIYFGRYSEEKGVGTLLEVCRKLPEILFVFAGDGPLADQVNNCKNALNCGFLTGEEIGSKVAKARFSVFPSEWYENCPFTVMESQGYGTPVIASNVGGTPELVQDGITGELFEAGNAVVLEKKIRKLWEDETLCRRYTQNCKKSEFDTLEGYCKNILNIYQEVKRRNA